MKTWFLNLSLSRKQMYALLTAGIIPTVIVALLSFIAEKNQIEKQAFNQLEAVRQIKASAVQRYFDTVESQLVTLANSRGTVDAMSAMTRSFSSAMSTEEPEAETLRQWRSDLGEFYRNQFGAEFGKRNVREDLDVTPLHKQLGDTAVLLQHAYIVDNQNPLGQKHLLDSARGEASYHFNHYLNHPTFRQYQERFGFYDIFLVDAATGNIVYSVFKELDFATSLLTGPYKDTNFAAAFRKATKLKAGQAVIEDFEIYLPSYNSPASFMASPITQGEDTIGVLVFQIPLEPINQIMSERSGMGDSGETYLIGEDFLMRSDSFLDPDQHSVEASFKHPDAGRVDTEAARLAVAGKSGNRIIKNYSGNSALSSFAPIEINGMKWAILAEINVSEAFAPVYRLAYMVIALCAVIAVTLYFAALYISGLITNPILVLSNSIRQVQTSGDFQRRIDIRQDDEIGQTCHSFNQLLSNLSSAFSNINGVLDELGNGRCDSAIDAVYSGDLGRLTDGVNRTAEQIQVAKRAQEKEAENARHSAEMAEKVAEKAQQQATDALIIKEALDVCDTSVMIADKDFNIIYLNNAVQELMQGLETEIKKEVTSFDASNLLGSNIDSFHKRPSHQRQLLSGLTETYKTRLQIAEVELNLSASPILSDKGELLGTVIEWRDMTEALARQREERRIADENARISQALENSSTGTMIADNEHNIIYANKSMTAMMANAENDLRNQYGQFDSRKIVGMNIDTFHTAPNHQRHILDQLSDTFSAEFNAGESTFNITANPIIGAEGERIGTVVEWVDRTAEVAIEKEIAGIIAAASKGDFSQRLNVSNKSGFFHRVSEGLNQITGQTEAALKDVLRVFSALSEGDLTQTIDSEFDGQFAQLKDDANKTILKLRDITSNIQHASTLIATAANQISAGNSDLSSRTETQASSLEETAASMEEITQTVLKSEENANKASSLSTSSTGIAQQGYSAVEDTAIAMTDISDASDRIASIIGVIDEIAFQTNLLALNAAVEAARAGEQGRGFAVVAGEVRNLAQRSSSAAKEIKDLINDSQVKVDNGIELVQNSKQTLNAIVEEIQGVNDMIIEISSSAREQSAGIEQVNSAVTQMDTITQQNAALVEEASAASAALAEQAQSLSGMISFFKQ